MKNNIKKKDPKVYTTSIIWSFATGMLAICIPLVKISQTGVILPLAVVTGASISTVAVWRDERQKSLPSSNDFQQIEQRIRDLETICIREN